MHKLQEQLLKLIDQKNIGDLTLREIGGLIGESLPQKVKHHLSQLDSKGFITIDKRSNQIRRTSNSATSSGLFVSIPILGTANCGPATIFADQNIDGYLKISKRLISSRKKIFAIRADGNSLNKANINGKSVESGDYLIIDSEKITPQNGDYVLSIIDDMANVKKYRIDKSNSRIALLSESAQPHPPIFIHEDDNFLINGKVIDVVKKLE